jgi:hypothetical protein
VITTFLNTLYKADSDARKRHIPVRPLIYHALFLMMLTTLLGCEGITGKKKGGEDPFVNTPSEISFSPLEGRVGEPYTANLQVSDKDGLKSIEVLGPDSTWTYTASGSDFSVNINKDFQTEGQRSILIKTTDSKDDVTQKGFVINVAPRAYVNSAPELEVSLESNQIDEASFRIKASDNKLIDRLELNYGNGTETIFVNRADIDTLITRNYGNQGGSFNFSARAVDNEGASTQEFKDFELLGRRNLLIDWETYLNQTPVNGGELRLKHKTIPFDTVLVSSNGKVEGLIPRGDYETLIVANPSSNKASENGHELSNISRINLTRNHLTNDYEPSFWHGREDTYIVSGVGVRSRNFGPNNGPAYLTWGVEDLPLDAKFNLKFYENLMSKIQTVENTFDATNTGSNGHLLEEMSRQLMGGTLIVYDVNQPLKIIHNWGDRNCPGDWSALNPVNCTPGVVPGIPISTSERGLPGHEMEALAKQVFSEYINERLKLMDDPRVGGRPWNVEIYGDWSENLKGKVYDERQNSVYFDFVNNFEYFAHSKDARESGTFSPNPPYKLNSSFASVGLGPAMSTSNFSNESRGGGFVKESKPLVRRSVRDDPLGAWSAGYSVVPRDRTYYPKDEFFHLIANGLGPYVQVQFVEGQVDFFNRRFNGFNVQIYHKDN